MVLFKTDTGNNLYKFSKPHPERNQIQKFLLQDSSFIKKILTGKTTVGIRKVPLGKRNIDGKGYES